MSGVLTELLEPLGLLLAATFGGRGLGAWITTCVRAEVESGGSAGRGGFWPRLTFAQ
jgi:hypothetical protein